MEANGNCGMVKNLVLALASAFIFVGAANAQAPVYRGTFTLPLEAQWGKTTLAAGDYTFTLDSLRGPTTAKIEQGKRNVALVMSQGHQFADSKASALIVARSGGRARIVALHAAELGTDFLYGTPKAEGQETVSAPQLIQRIPVLTNGK
jgi:hypothetical protein